jgi:LysM repeat protein
VTVAVLLIRDGLHQPEPPPATTAAATTRPATTAPPATTTAPAPTTTAPASTRTYTIKAGDTLDQIAIDNDTSVEQLLALNPTLDPRSLQVGQQVKLP